MRSICIKNIFCILYKNNIFLKKKYYGYISIPENIKVNIFNEKIFIVDNNLSILNSFYKIILNLIKGIDIRWNIEMNISGIGYKLSIIGDKLIFNLGYSNLVIINLPYYIDLKINKNIINLYSVYKDKLGIFANTLFNLKKFNPYKSKGIYQKKKVNLKKSNKKKQ